MPKKCAKRWCAATTNKAKKTSVLLQTASSNLVLGYLKILASPSFCKEHKCDEMVDLLHKTCSAPNCNKQP